MQHPGRLRLPDGLGSPRMCLRVWGNGLTQKTRVRPRATNSTKVCLLCRWRRRSELSYSLPVCISKRKFDRALYSRPITSVLQRRRIEPERCLGNAPCPSADYIEETVVASVCINIHEPRPGDLVRHS